MTVFKEYSKMAEELHEKARNEASPYVRSDFETVAQIYALLAQRAQAIEQGDETTALPGKQMPQKLDASMKNDARSLQQKIQQHFPAGHTTRT